MLTIIFIIIYVEIGSAVAPILTKYISKEAHNYMSGADSGFNPRSIDGYIILFIAMFFLWLPFSIIISIHSRMRK